MRREEQSGERKGRKIKGEKKEKRGDSTGGNKRIQERKEKVKRRYELTTVMNNYNIKKAMNINQLMRSNEEINEIEKYQSTCTN